jgi:hypothetical protein
VEYYLLSVRKQLCVECEKSDTCKLAWHRHQRYCQREEKETARSTQKTTKASEDKEVSNSCSDKPVGLVRFVQENTILMSLYTRETFVLIAFLWGLEMHFSKFPDK